MSSAILRATRDVRPWEIAPFRESEIVLELPGERETAPSDPEAALAAANIRATEITQLARREADTLRARAQAEAEQLQRAAYEEGVAAGRAAAQEEWETRCRDAAALIDAVGAAYGSFCQAQAGALATLALAAAEKLLREQLTLEPERVVTIVEEALASTLANATVSVHLHPDDLEIVAAHRAAWPQDGRRPTLDVARASPDSDAAEETPEGERRASAAGRPVIRLVADGTVERGGCWLENEQGEVDATVGGRVSRLARAMED